ncbi:hypothetical protein CFK37_13425 [Virgibacillus phasianinus]|uniref:SpoOB alpha-helical domain-containing protein n=1 Tax=Virgibacillus phasianinus TaxID=2017483 RepID=A0A220U4U0_9BACI|nr:Spo0B domain-containing protein [Virgibacillus phasianinus]ASK63075.1 hypothetical protein CFK37_13425 [Virgibacillus phasianinus]
MEEKEVMELLRYYRHDVMNDLQIVQAYTSMGKLEKVEEKLADYLSRFDEERKLMNLNAPNLALWLIPFNSIHPNFRFTYTILGEKINLADIDGKLTTNCEYCIRHLEKITSETELYEGEVVLEYFPDLNQVKVRLSLDGSFHDINNDSKRINKNITQQQSGNHVTLTVIIPRNRKGEEKCL